MPSISVSPNPAAPSAKVTATGTSFSNASTRLVLDGVVVVQPFRPGSPTFTRTLTVSGITTTQVLAAQQQKGKNTSPWYEVARTNVVVQGGAPLFTISNIVEGNITQTSAVISWNASAPSTGQVEYGTTTAYGTFTTLEPTLRTDHAQQIPSSGQPPLEANTTYYYRIRATDAGGRAVTATGDFATLASAPTATVPGAPTNLTGSAAATTVNLAWSAPASDGGSAITGYRVYRSTSGGAYSLAATLNVVLTWQDTGRTLGTTYTYQVSAVNAVGEGAKSTVVVTVTTRPWAAPVTTQTIAVPDAVLGSGLNAWLASQANGSIIVFPAKTYSMTAGFQIFGRNNLILRGTNTVLNISGADDVNTTAFQLRYSDHITIDGTWTVSFTGYTAWPGQQGEASHTLSTAGWGGGAPSSYVEMTGVNTLKAYGDFVYLEGRNLAPYEPSHHIWIHHNTGRKCGRNAVSPIDCTDVLIEDNDFSEVAYHAYDLEPNFAGQQIRRLTIRNETVGSYAHRSGLLGWFVSSWQPMPGSGPFAPISDITVDGNTVVGIASNGTTGTPRALHTDFSTQQRATNVVFTNNSTSRTVPGTVLYFNYCTGVRVQGNTQPLSSGSLASFPNSSGIINGPNP